MKCRFARYLIVDDTACYECLDEHLALTSFLSMLLYTMVYRNRVDVIVLKCLSLAGLLHDIGKALSIYQKRFEQEHKLSFSRPPHEVLSARIARTILLKLKDKVFSEVRSAAMNYYIIEKLIIQPIEKHHQGLRIIRCEDLTEVLDNIAHEDIESINYVLRKSIAKILEYIEKTRNFISDDIVETVTKISKLNLELHSVRLEKPRKISVQINKDDELRFSELSKIVTGFLIISDYMATEINLSKIDRKCVSETRLSREIRDYVCSLGILDYVEKLTR